MSNPPVEDSPPLSFPPEIPKSVAIAKGIAIRIIEIQINQVATVAILTERIGRTSDRQKTANITNIVNFRNPLVISRQDPEQA